jgi:YidC/Oxa1 family membrane protein insertase
VIVAFLAANPLKPLEDLFTNVLHWLHTAIGLPWAWAIVAVTVIVRMLLVPLAVRQIHSMQNMQRFAPQMKEIQRKYKEDKQRQQEELMKFYRENNINPAASCLPLVAQIPVFLGLYYALRHFASHPPGGNAAVARGDFSWLGKHFVPDITAHANSHWTGYLLLAIYAASQVGSTLLMPSTMDKTQRRIMLIFPLVVIVFLVRFPTGLVIYWVTTNLWTVGQGLITRRLMPKIEAPPRRTSRTPRKDEPDSGDGAKPKQPKPAPSGTQPAKQPVAKQPAPKPAATKTGQQQKPRPVKKKRARR